ncbi:MAG: hypothetical protein H6Q66_1980 [Firmicutes bacterium]|nr:hypothetical protein [Bacillota bacterium]
MNSNLNKISSVFNQFIDETRWVCYKKVWDESRRKFNKIPISPITGCGAKSNDSRTWATYNQALVCMRSHKKIAGIMIALSADDDLVGIDIDDCISDGQISTLAQRIIHVASSYTEISPSGHGIRIMLFGELPPAGRKNTANGVEMYDSGRFLTITGNHLEGSPLQICDRHEQVAAIHREYIKPKKYSIGQAEFVQQSKRRRSMELDDAELVEIASYAANGESFEDLYSGDWDNYPSQSEADAAFCCMLAFWTGWNAEQTDRIFRASGLYREKWDSIRYADGRTYGAALISWAIENTDNCYMQEDK